MGTLPLEEDDMQHAGESPAFMIDWHCGGTVDVRRHEASVDRGRSGKAGRWIRESKLV